MTVEMCQAAPVQPQRTMQMTKSTLESLQHGCAGLRVTGKGRGLFNCAGHCVHVDVESEDCTTLKVRSKEKVSANPWTDLERLRAQSAAPGPWKLVECNGRLELLAETWTGEPFDGGMLAPMVAATLPSAHAVIHSGETPSSCGAAPDDGDRAEVRARLYAAAEGLPIELREDERGWFSSYDTPRHLHRLSFALERAGAVTLMRAAIPCETLQLRADAPARAVRDFLLEANARHRFARVSLESVPRESGLKSVRPLAEAAVPVAMLSRRLLRTLLGALVFAAGSIREETVLLSAPESAELYLKVRAGAGGTARVRKPA